MPETPPGGLIPRLKTALLEHEWKPGETWSDMTAHARHGYDSTCAICRHDLDRVLALVLRELADVLHDSCKAADDLDEGSGELWAVTSAITWLRAEARR